MLYIYDTIYFIPIKFQINNFTNKLAHRIFRKEKKAHTIFRKNCIHKHCARKMGVKIYLHHISIGIFHI